MTKKMERFVVAAQPVKELIYHNIDKMSKSGGGATLYKYLDASLVEEADLTVFGREIRDVPPDAEPYVEPHTHEVSQVFLFLGNLTAEAILDGERYDITAPACIFIPAGTRHSIRVTKGSGNTVVILRGQAYE